MQVSNHFDVIVIGVGSMGSSACCFLAEQGLKVLGLEQFDIIHENGSHTGQSRIIRKAYFEHPDYVPLLKRSYENWQRLEAKTNAKIYHRTGIVYFGLSDHPTMKGVKSSARLHDISLDVLPNDEAKVRFKSFSIPGDFETLYEHDAGFVTPELAINCYVEQAKANGAIIRSNTRVLSWKEEAGKIIVTTDKDSLSADRLILTVGSWTSKLIPNLNANLKVTRQMMAWVQPKSPEAFALGNFPCWFIEDPDHGMFYGFPILSSKFDGPSGLKLASHSPGDVVNPDRVDRKHKASEEEAIRHLLSKYIPSAGTDIINIKTCLYTYSDDENFVIDHLPGYNKRVTIACGFSGHGFKFVSAIGEILADLAMKGKSELPIGFLQLSRFKKQTL